MILDNTLIWSGLVLALAGLILWVGFFTGRASGRDEKLNQVINIIEQRIADLNQAKRATFEPGVEQELEARSTELSQLKDTIKHGRTHNDNLQS